MTYTKKTWGTEDIKDTDLNNMETGIDDIHNQVATLAGVKTLSSRLILDLTNPNILFREGGVEKAEIKRVGVSNALRIIAKESGKYIEFYNEADVEAAKILAKSINDIVIESHASRHQVGGGDPLLVGAPSSLVADGGNVEGSLTKFARQDHIHDAPCGIPVDIGTVNAEGSATDFARRDHIHKHASGLGESLHHTYPVPTAGIANDAVTKKYIAESYTNISHNTSSWVVMTGMTITQTFGNNPVLIMFSGEFYNDAIGKTIDIAIFVDGTKQDYTQRRMMSWSSTYIDYMTMNTQHLKTLTAGSRTIDVRWNVSGGVGRTQFKNLIVIELKK